MFFFTMLKSAHLAWPPCTNVFSQTECTCAEA